MVETNTKKPDLEQEVSQLTKQMTSLIERNMQLERENNLFRDNSPLVGVRWYGEGGATIRLSNRINGYTKVDLNGFGDKAVIDLATWTSRTKDGKLVKQGVLVRDDAVIDELNVKGVVAEPDISKNSNSLTLQEIKELLKSKISIFKKRLDEFTYPAPLWAMVRVAKDIGFDNYEKLMLTKERAHYLFAYNNVDRLHNHELFLGCQLAGIKNPEDMDRDEAVKLLTEFEIGNRE